MVFAGSVHLAHALDALAGRERFAYGLLGRLDRPARRTFVLVVFVVVFVSDRTTTSFLWSSLLRRRLLFLARPRWLIVIVIRDRGTVEHGLEDFLQVLDLEPLGVEPGRRLVVDGVRRVVLAGPLALDREGAVHDGVFGSPPLVEEVGRRLRAHDHPRLVRMKVHDVREELLSRPDTVVAVLAALVTPDTRDERTSFAAGIEVLVVPRPSGRFGQKADVSRLAVLQPPHFVVAVSAGEQTLHVLLTADCLANGHAPPTFHVRYLLSRSSLTC